MSPDALTYALLSAMIGLEVFIYERIAKLERDVGYLRGFLGLGAGTDPPEKVVAEVGRKEAA